MAIIRYWMVALLAAMPVAAQTPGATLSGFVTDADNGEALILAVVVVEELQLGATSNNSGYYASQASTGWHPRGEHVAHRLPDPVGHAEF